MCFLKKPLNYVSYVLFLIINQKRRNQPIMGYDSTVPNQQVELLAKEAQQNERPTASFWAPAYISNEIDRLEELLKIIALSSCRVLMMNFFALSSEKPSIEPIYTQRS